MNAFPAQWLELRTFEDRLEHPTHVLRNVKQRTPIVLNWYIQIGLCLQTLKQKWD